MSFLLSRLHGFVGLFSLGDYLPSHLLYVLVFEFEDSILRLGGSQQPTDLDWPRKEQVEIRHPVISGDVADWLTIPI